MAGRGFASCGVAFTLWPDPNPYPGATPATKQRRKQVAGEVAAAGAAGAAGVTANAQWEIPKLILSVRIATAIFADLLALYVSSSARRRGHGLRRRLGALEDDSTELCQA